MTTLLPGTYRLTSDVTNPKPLRRRYGWTSNEIIKAGAVFAVQPKPVDRDQIELAMRMDRETDEVFASHPLFAALAPFLEAVVEEPSDLLARLGWSLMAPQILNQLCRDGLLTIAQVETAAQKYYEALGAPRT